MKRILIPAMVMICFVTFNAFAQLNVPRPSPSSTVMQKIGLADVTISYSRPSAKGRKVFGDVVPFDKIWRTGANEPTKISITDTVMIEGNKIAPGDYGLYTIPGATEWTIILGKNPKTQAGDYKDDQQAARFKVKTEKLCAPVETFTIDFTNLTTGSASIQLSWESTSVKFKIENEVDSKVMADIKAKTENRMTYFQAASYYYETNRDLKQALEWINKATEGGGMFFQVHLKAKILAKMGDCKGATEAAQKSMEMAKVAKNDEYVKFNEKVIADCAGKK
ncbi:MAG: DUF2911 domain-containing protein [Cytophagaceae bacterium]